MLVDETDAQGPGRELVQVVHAKWAQKLNDRCEERALACPRAEKGVPK